jgi:hypothetical protein
MTPAPVVHPRIAGLTEFLVRCMVAATVWFGAQWSGTGNTLAGYLLQQ